MFVVPELSKRTTRTTFSVHLDSDGLVATSSASFQVATAPPKIRETSLGVKFSDVGAVPPQFPAVRFTGSASEEPPPVTDISVPAVSSFPGHSAGELGWKGGRNLPSARLEPLHAFPSFSVSRPGAP